MQSLLLYLLGGSFLLLASFISFVRAPSLMNLTYLAASVCFCAGSIAGLTSH